MVSPGVHHKIYYLGEHHKIHYLGEHHKNTTPQIFEGLNFAVFPDASKAQKLILLINFCTHLESSDP